MNPSTSPQWRPYVRIRIRIRIHIHRHSGHRMRWEMEGKWEKGANGCISGRRGTDCINFLSGFCSPTGIKLLAAGNFVWMKSKSLPKLPFPTRPSTTYHRPPTTSNYSPMSPVFGFVFCTVFLQCCSLFCYRATMTGVWVKSGRNPVQFFAFAYSTTPVLVNCILNE